MSLVRSKADAPLFTFAVLADTHVNPEDDRSSSPWATNRLANARARAVVAQINALEPAFVVHAGDMVHPLPSQPAYAVAVERFRALFADLCAPLHVIPGNHEVGDKPTSWMPAAAVDAPSLATFRRHFGSDRFAFDRGDCRFVGINNPIFNSGLPDEHAQWDWLDTQLATDRRIFLFAHYPPFLLEPKEDEHYDNLAEPGRSRFLDLLRRHRVEALFCAHVHNFFYNRVGGTDCYVLPTTSTLRHEYMELFPVRPVWAEHGRDAHSKLGFFRVEVFPTGHVAHWVRSGGETEPAHLAAGLRVPRTHARGPVTAPLGVDLRHGWADPVSIPYTGVVDEFGRKRVRNDYAVAALWQLGIRKLRIPLQDLLAPITARRVADLAACGHRFTVFAFGLPDAKQRSALARLSASLDGIEIVERYPALLELAAAAAALRSELGVPVFLSNLRVSAETEHDTGRFAHFIRHGFVASETETLATETPALDGLVYRVGRNEAPWPTLQAIAEHARAIGQRAIAHVLLAADNPAEDMADDAETARRVADAALAAWAHRDHLSVFLDTFADHDRGYFPRHGLVDRACDPRPAGRVLEHLAEALHAFDPQLADVTAHGAARVIQAPEQEQLAVLFLGSDRSEVTLSRSGAVSLNGTSVSGTRLDTGTTVAARTHIEGNVLVLEWHEQPSGHPVLISIPLVTSETAARRALEADCNGARMMARRS